MIRKWSLLLIGIVLIFGCQSKDETGLIANLQEFENRLETAEKKIEEWKAIGKALGEKVEEVNSENENLKIQANETDEWIGYVIKAIGPCVWAGGPFEKPEPREIVKNGAPAVLLTKLNQIFVKTEFPKVALSKIENETAYLKVSDDAKLTRGMGTSGAANYLNSITYTFWSIKHIQCVDIDFEAGDHAFPTRNCIVRESE